MARRVKVNPDIPKKWRRIDEGVVKYGDKFFNMLTKDWEKVEIIDIGQKVKKYAALIRINNKNGVKKKTSLKRK